MATFEIDGRKLGKIIRLLKELTDDLEAISGEKPKKPKVVKQVDAALLDKVQNVVNFYRQIHPNRGKTIKPGDRLWKIIEARINQGYTAEQCRMAIVGNNHDDWYKKRGRHSIQNIFSNDSHFERFIELPKQLTRNAESEKKEKASSYGYNGGSEEFSDGHVDFGD
jgi:hypothetical protein